MLTVCVIRRTLQMATIDDAIRTRAGLEAKHSNEENKISDFVARITTRVAHAEKTLSTPPSDYSKKLSNTEHNRTLPTTARITHRRSHTTVTVDAIRTRAGLEATHSNEENKIKVTL